MLLTSPLHVEYSHYLVTDVTMGACGLLALAAGLAAGARGPARARPAGRRGRSGLAAAAKYNGVYIGLPVALAWAIAWRRTRRADPDAGRSRALAGASPPAWWVPPPLVFLITNPYVILDWPDWSRGFVFQVNAYVPATHRSPRSPRPFGKQVDALWTTDTVLLAAGVAGSLLLLLDALLASPAGCARLCGPPGCCCPSRSLYTLLMSRFTEVYERNLIVTLPCLCLAGGLWRRPACGRKRRVRVQRSGLRVWQ